MTARCAMHKSTLPPPPPLQWRGGHVTARWSTHAACVVGDAPPSMEGRSRDRPMDCCVGMFGRPMLPSMEGRSRDRPMGLRRHQPR